MSTEPSKKLTTNKDSASKDNHKKDSVKDKKVSKFSFAEYQELDNKYRRALADQQNLIKQHQKDRQNYLRYANEQLLLEMIPVYDNLKLSCQHFNSNNPDSWLEGINYIIKQFKNTLTQAGIEEIYTKEQPFNHLTMEATEMIITDQESLDNLVAEEIKPGYQLADRTIIPARVKVYQFKAKSDK